ncbi:hypothetical protein R6Q57_013371 [Mikania cordata]
MKIVNKCSLPARKSERIAIKSLSSFRNTEKNPIEVCSDDDFVDSTPSHVLLRFKHKRRRPSNKTGTPNKRNRVRANEEKEHSKDEDVEQFSRKGKKPNNGTPKKKIEASTSSKNGKDKVDKYPIIFNSCSPKQLVRALKKLSTKQEEKVRKIGFGGILSLQVDGIPLRLGYFVADKFHERRMLLGIANSSCNLLDVEPNKPLNPRILEWRDSYKSEYIASTEIVKRIICNGDDDSFDFVLNFLVLFIATMVECHSHGKCKLEILEYLTADTDFKDINWCTYILSRIKVCKSRWAGTSTSPFRGALTILTLLSVDSVTLAAMNVDHKILTVAFWDLERLKERENIGICHGSFGKGTYVGMSGVECNMKIKSVVVEGNKTLENLSIEDQFTTLEQMLKSLCVQKSKHKNF